ncbi:hypothetical protein ASE36_00070 [Rhizobium sp. Root274]|uniref:hypothetical protein n=1 Tax=unclassified Rhizobium TaxID=2613769 RepID=UPI00071467B3|nr:MULTISPECIES: hypothetical protein [unclassified Rhizobium]KQW30735.1 hypothetical protein ASC71_00070 [Rhizobium sp. Root1240]KRD32282.1 hypothetical protein ASE36_00070 [Rhizobium sp. Root274]
MTRQIPLPDNKSSTLGDFPYPYVEVVCRKCWRSGRYATVRLIEEHGADLSFMDLRRRFESTCSKTNDISRLNEVCGVSFPDMIRWKLGREPSI